MSKGDEPFQSLSNQERFSYTPSSVYGYEFCFFAVVKSYQVCYLSLPSNDVVHKNSVLFVCKDSKIIKRREIKRILSVISY